MPTLGAPPSEQVVDQDAQVHDALSAGFAQSPERRLNDRRAVERGRMRETASVERKIHKHDVEPRVEILFGGEPHRVDTVVRRGETVEKDHDWARPVSVEPGSRFHAIVGY